MYGRWRLDCLVGCEPWLDSPGEGRGDPSPSGPPSWKCFTNICQMNPNVADTEQIVSHVCLCFILVVVVCQ